MANTSNNAATADREIVLTRVFHAPGALIWKAWTDPDQLVQWWGPKGFTNTFHEIDVRPGGAWRFTMHGPDGTDYENRVVFDQVVPPLLLVYTHGVGENDPAPFHVTVTFGDHGSKTRLTMRMVFATPTEREKGVKFGAVEGGNQTLERLAQFLIALQRGSSNDGRR